MKNNFHKITTVEDKYLRYEDYKTGNRRENSHK